mgnify:CR=1 FL=1
MIFKIICLFLLLGYTPYMAGNLVTRRYDRYQRRADIAYIIGFMVMMTLFELAAVPVIFKVRYGSFRMLFIIYSVMIIAVDVMGTFIWLKDRGLAGSGKNICSVRRQRRAAYMLPEKRRLMAYMLPEKRRMMAYMWAEKR